MKIYSRIRYIGLRHDTLYIIYNLFMLLAFLLQKPSLLERPEVLYVRYESCFLLQKQLGSTDNIVILISKHNSYTHSVLTAYIRIL